MGQRSRTGNEGAVVDRCMHDDLAEVELKGGLELASRLSDTLADEWMRLPNANPIFDGATPLASVMRGGLPAMQIVRRLFDARRAG